MGTRAMLSAAVLVMLAAGPLPADDHRAAVQARAGERFAAAARQLDAPALPERLEAVEALGTLARQVPAVHWRVVETLAAFVRQGSARPGADVRAAAAVVARRRTALDPPGARIDLTGADLTDAVLTGGTLRDARLAGAVLHRADVRGIDLRGADLTAARLTWTRAGGADLTGADLSRSAMTGAGLTGARLTGARLHHAVLDGTDLAGADLSDADFTDAYLGYVMATGTAAPRARFTGANLGDIVLVDADLTGATFDRAWLGGAVLTRARVTADQLGCGVVSPSTRLPDGMARVPARTAACLSR